MAAANCPERSLTNPSRVAKNWKPPKKELDTTLLCSLALDRRGWT